jgi:hypothetical protein
MHAASRNDVFEYDNSIAGLSHLKNLPFRTSSVPI